MIFAGFNRRPSTPLLVGGGSVAALILGALFAHRTVEGLLALGCVGFIAAVMVDITFGFVAWIAALFVSPGIVTSLIGLGIATAWFGSIIIARPRLSELLPGQRFLTGAAALLLTWLSLSVLWARDPHLAWHDLRGWLIAAAVLVVVGTTITTPRRLRLVLASFVLGALLSVVVGVLKGGGSPRFAGAEGNANDFAAQLIPVIVIAAALITDQRRKAERTVLGVATAVLVVALAATESRGGLVACGLTVLAAVAIFYRHARQMLAALALIAAVAAAWFALSPGAFQRVTSFTSGGAGRTTLWDAAWRMTADRAPFGVGLNNFRIVSQDYVRKPGLLPYVSQIESPHVVHNTYLQLLAETGPIGLGLFLAVVLASLSSTRRAASRFALLGRRDLDRLARAVLVAVVSVLAAQLFQSNGYDVGLWVLLGLGPALLVTAAAAEGAGSRQVAVAPIRR